MPDLSTSWPWLSLALLGAFHGLNPAMGWLFAVALGLQQRRDRAVLTALGPIALGHALAIALAVVVVGLLGLIIPRQALLVIGGLLLLGFSAYKIATRFRHPRWVGLRVTPRQLVLWSFLMATAHGAGLMLVPVIAAFRGDDVPSALAHAGHAGHMDHQMPDSHDALLSALAAVGVHSLAMLAVAGAMALVVYHRLGIEILRRAWLNLDLIWVGALALAGALTLAVALWPLLST